MPVGFWGWGDSQNEATLEILTTDTVVKHSAKIAIKWASDRPLEELKRAALFRGCFQKEINQLGAAEPQRDPGMSLFQMCRMPRQRSVREKHRLHLKLKHESGCNFNVSCWKKGHLWLGRGFLKVISHRDVCLPLTFHLADAQVFWHMKWVLSTPHGCFYQHLWFLHEEECAPIGDKDPPSLRGWTWSSENGRKVFILI